MAEFVTAMVSVNTAITVKIVLIIMFDKLLSDEVMSAAFIKFFFFVFCKKRHRFMLNFSNVALDKNKYVPPSRRLSTIRRFDCFLHAYSSRGASAAPRGARHALSVVYQQLQVGKWQPRHVRNISEGCSLQISIFN